MLEKGGGQARGGAAVPITGNKPRPRILHSIFDPPRWRNIGIGNTISDLFVRSQPEIVMHEVTSPSMIGLYRATIRFLPNETEIRAEHLNGARASSKSSPASFNGAPQ
jgi:hypothetical protein